MTARRRKTRRARTDRSLATEWRRWIAENLAQGADPERVRAALVDQGVPAAEAKRRVDEALGAPALAVARTERVRADRLEQILRLLRQQLATRTAPTEVERVAGLDAPTFFERYYATCTPVVLTDFMDDWPDLASFSPEGLAERFGEVEVEVCEGRDADRDYDVNAAQLTSRCTLGTLCARVLEAGETNDFYMIARNRNLEGPLSPLLDEVPCAHGILSADRLRGGCQLWLGPAGTVTPLHHDTSNILFCQTWGDKRVRLASPVESALLAGARAMYAAVDPERPDLEAHPWFAEVALRQVELGPGDALFIPAGWWHHVRALTAAVSVAFVAFTRDNDLTWYTPGALDAATPRRADPAGRSEPV